MRVPLRRMGNSSGVIIPKPFLAQIGAAGAVEMAVEQGRIVIEAEKTPARAGWAQASRTLAETGDDALAWPEFTNDGDEALEW
jgi:antitoxin MazE